MTAAVHLVFDLDGTLVDSATVVHGLIDELRAERGLPPMPRADLVPLMSIGGVAMMRAALAIDESQAELALQVFRARYAQRSTPPQSVYPGVEEALAKLQSHGVGLSICTNKPRLLATKVLEEAQLKRFFSSLCAGDDLPSRKPDIQNFRASLPKEMPQPCQVLVVGDSTVDQALALRAGVPFLFFSGGYDDGVETGRVKAQFRSYLQFPYTLVTG